MATPSRPNIPTPPGSTGDQAEFQEIPKLQSETTQITDSQKSPLTLRKKSSNQATEFKSIWDGQMKEMGGLSAPHTKTVVLMLSWDPDGDDLGTADEVARLTLVFQKKFNYKVIHRCITKEKPAHQQAQKYLADFVYEYDNKSTLLIVYYAGHGIPVGENKLHLAGKRYHQETLPKKNSTVIWNEAEHNLRAASGDVLVLFDCCYAGHLAGRSSSPLRCFEFLAACNAEERTPAPGPNSFTSALIWALELLLSEKSRFTTDELLAKIRSYVGDSQNIRQNPFACERDHPCERKLVLAPIPSDQESRVKIEKENESMEQAPNIEQYLDLRFFFGKSLTEEDVSNLASAIRQMILSTHPEAQRVTWRGLHDMNVKEIALRTLEAFRSNSIRRRKTRNSEDAEKEGSRRRRSSSVGTPNTNLSPHDCYGNRNLITPRDRRSTPSGTDDEASIISGIDDEPGSFASTRLNLNVPEGIIQKLSHNIDSQHSHAHDIGKVEANVVDSQKRFNVTQSLPASTQKLNELSSTPMGPVLPLCFLAIIFEVFHQVDTASSFRFCVYAAVGAVYCYHHWSLTRNFL